MNENNNTSEHLNLVHPGSLPIPGQIGRVVRAIIGLACLYALYQLMLYRSDIIQTPFSELDNLVLMLIVPLLIINDVVNIGFGVNWKRKPRLVSFVGLLLLALLTWVLYKTLDNVLLGSVLWAWLVSFYVHVGFSFILSALIATPGCEMRAIPDLYGKLSGKPAQEHHCPAFLAKVDAWEQQRK